MLAIFDAEKHRYTDKSGKEYPSVSFLLAHFGISNIAEVSKYVKPETMQLSRDFGKELHRTTVMDDQNQLGKCDEGIVPYLLGWRQYVADHKPNFIAYEQPLLSTTWGFAGTPDRVDDRGKWLDVPDIKTGVKTVAEEIQTALYAILIEEHYCKQVKDRYTVHVKEFGYKLERHTDKMDFNIAKSILTIFKYKLKRGLFQWSKSN